MLLRLLSVYRTFVFTVDGRFFFFFFHFKKKKKRKFFFKPTHTKTQTKKKESKSKVVSVFTKRGEKPKKRISDGFIVTHVSNYNYEKKKKRVTQKGLA